MPTITNKSTGVSYPVSQEQLEATRNNETIKHCFTYQDTEVPEEVKQLQDLSLGAAEVEKEAERPKKNAKPSDTNEVV